MSEPFDSMMQIVERGPAPRTQGELVFWRTFAPVTATTTPTELIGAPLAGRRKLVIRNDGANGVRVGDANVSTTRGFLLAANESREFEVGAGVAVYVAAVSGTTTLNGYEGY